MCPLCKHNALWCPGRHAMSTGLPAVCPSWWCYPWQIYKLCKWQVAMAVNPTQHKAAGFYKPHCPTLVQKVSAGLFFWCLFVSEQLPDGTQRRLAATGSGLRRGSAPHSRAPAVSPCMWLAAAHVVCVRPRVAAAVFHTSRLDLVTCLQNTDCTCRNDQK